MLSFYVIIEFNIFKFLKFHNIVGLLLLKFFFSHLIDAGLGHTVNLLIPVDIF